MVKIGSYLKVNVTKYVAYLVFFVLLAFPTQIIGQGNAFITLHEALLDIAKTEKLSIVFSTSNIPKKIVSKFQKTNSIDQQLSYLLKGTGLSFEIKNKQIFLYRKHKIFGYIEDESTGERLIGATILNYESMEYSVTNEYGYFSFSTRNDTAKLEISYVGYGNKNIILRNDDFNNAYTIKLEPDNSINQVLITDNLVSEDDRKYIELDKGSDILLNNNQAVTALGGEPDIFQAMIRQSGVSSGTDGIGGIHVRGGKNDQNLILYDGVKLYHSAHAFGMFSAFNSNIVDQTRMYKSGASGSNFGRLSSVLDVKINDPDLQKVKGNIQLSTLAGQATLEAPIIKDKLGILISGRKTYIDPYIDHISKSSGVDFFGEEITGYNFNDVNFKLYGKLNKRNRLYINYYEGKDNYTDFYKVDLIDEYYEPYYYDYDLAYNWKNKIASLRWNSLIGKSSFANIQFSSYKYDYRNQAEDNLYDAAYGNITSFSGYNSYNAQTTNYELKVDLETVLKSHHLKYGVNASQKDYQIGELYMLEEESVYGDFPKLDISNLLPDTLLGYSNKEVTIYISDKLKFSKDWMLEGGLYHTIHKSKDEEFPLETQMATFGYLKTLNKVNQNLYIGGSIGTYIQTEHLLSLGDNGYPNDIWVPSTDTIPFQRSYQVELFSELEHGKHKFRASSFYKLQSGILRYPDFASLPGLTDLLPELWELEVQIGEAKGYGIEIDYSYKNADKLTFRGVYTYANTEYTFDLINGGKPFPFDYSVPHTFSFGLNIKLYSQIRLSIDWFASSGKPYTLYNSNLYYSPLDIGGNLEVIPISKENEFRLPDVHKLSAMLSTQWKWSGVQSNFSLGIQNVYNRRNIILQYDLEGEGLQSQQGFPILPMLLWRLSF